MDQAEKSARVIVFGNSKGGSGKSTCALHTAIALLQAGHKVATIDLDSPQQTLTRAISNRIAWNRKTGRALVVPEHYIVENSSSDSVSQREREELDILAEIVGHVEAGYDFLIVDTPGYDTPINRLVHSLADTIVTPLNDSFVDLDLLIQPEQGETNPSIPGPYARLVEGARRQRRHLDGKTIEWIVVQNRLTQISSNNKAKVRDALVELANRLGFRIARGVSERVIFREFFTLGVTAFDPLDKETFGVKPSISHVSARDEVRRLVAAIGLEDAAGFKKNARNRAGMVASQAQKVRVQPKRRVSTSTQPTKRVVKSKSPTTLAEIAATD